jgi:hypothetical protein
MWGVRWVGDDRHFLFRQKLLGEDGSMRWGVVMVKQPGLFSPKFWATSSHVFTQSPQNVAVEPGIHSLACWDRCFALPQLLYRWRRQTGIFWISSRKAGIYSIGSWILIDRISLDRTVLSYLLHCLMEAESVSETPRFSNRSKTTDVQKVAQSCLERNKFVNCSKSSRISRRPKHVIISLPFFPILSQINLPHLFPSYFLKILLNIIPFF